MITEQDVLSVSCPDCLAPEGEDCRFSNPTYAGSVHANRRDRARWRLAIPGTCDLCHQVMLKASDPDDAWHPATVERACPPEPSTDPYDVRGWQEFINAGYRTGRPGLEHFIPDTIPDPTPAELDERIERLHGPGAVAAIEAAFADGSIFVEEDEWTPPT